MHGFTRLVAACPTGGAWFGVRYREHGLGRHRHHLRHVRPDHQLGPSLPARRRRRVRPRRWSAPISTSGLSTIRRAATGSRAGPPAKRSANRRAAGMQPVRRNRVGINVSKGFVHRFVAPMHVAGVDVKTVPRFNVLLRATRPPGVATEQSPRVHGGGLGPDGEPHCARPST
jgi:hypothetical protein